MNTPRKIISYKDLELTSLHGDVKINSQKLICNDIEILNNPEIFELLKNDTRHRTPSAISIADHC